VAGVRGEAVADEGGDMGRIEAAGCHGSPDRSG
jgi:hypothetical protein